MKFKSIKKKMKELKEPIMEQLAAEYELQARLRTTITTSDDITEIAASKNLLQDSVEHCEVLMEALKEYKHLSEQKWNFSPDALLTVAGNLFGILLVLNFEKLDIIRSKAFGMIIKGRI